jgi:hypothetical protein
MQSTELDIKSALNDLPTLYSNLVQNVDILDDENIKIINITFSSLLGKKCYIINSSKFGKLDLKNNKCTF